MLPYSLVSYPTVLPGCYRGYCLRTGSLLSGKRCLFKLFFEYCLFVNGVKCFLTLTPHIYQQNNLNTLRMFSIWQYFVIKFSRFWCHDGFKFLLERELCTYLMCAWKIYFITSPLGKNVVHINILFMAHWQVLFIFKVYIIRPMPLFFMIFYISCNMGYECIR
jgi:hypothetical protein